ncbi:MAG: chorismate synthase [Puia sp.]
MVDTIGPMEFSANTESKNAKAATVLPIIKTGIFNDRTTGAPITILFENNNTRSGDYEKLRAIPRPGHADFVAHENLVVMKITAVVVISVEDSPLRWWQQV